MQTPLPKKLNADPIIDAIIEIRVVVNQPLNSIMPGVLLQAQDVGYLRSQELPAASIPEAVRRSDPNLRYQPLVRAEFKDGFNLLIGDAVLAVVASMPYVGGVGFKSKATQILTLLLGLPVVERVQRLSMKYTDFIEAESFSNKGGWKVDQQFMDLMGSPYLLAHGMGVPVDDASTEVTFPEKGEYYV